jgi:hypothetical protein
MVQLITSKDRQHVQQFVITLVPTTIQVNTNLLTYVLGGFTHQPLDGGQLEHSPRRSSSQGDMLGGPPFNSPIGSCT